MLFWSWVFIFWEMVKLGLEVVLFWVLDGGVMVLVGVLWFLRGLDWGFLLKGLFGKRVCVMF